jgi:hypothetical protein
MASSSFGGVATYQKWTFDDADNPAFAEIDENDFGVPTATITVEGPACGVPAGWLSGLQDEDPMDGNPDGYLGRFGVWHSEHTTATLFIPNNPVSTPNSYKDVWLTMGFRANLQSQAYSLTANIPTTGGIVVEGGIPVVVADDGWYIATIHWRIYPNPLNETINISIMDSGADIDYITVSTVCIPEPATLCLLGLGAMLFRKR